MNTSGPVGSNLNNSKVVAGIPAAAGQPRKRSRRNNPSRLRRNARSLQHFLDRKSSSGNNPQPALTDSVVSGQWTEWCAEADDLKDFIEKDVSCVDFAINEGQPSLDLELANGNHVRTPVATSHET